VSGDVSSCLGNGDGTFRPKSSYSIVSTFGSVAVADVNDDGKTDLALLGSDGSGLVLIGEGDGTFQPSPPFSFDTYASSLVALDLDGDSKPDLASLISLNVNGSVSISILPGDGTGQFGVASRIPVIGQPDSLVATDVNGDGNVDLAVSGRVVAVSFKSVSLTTFYIGDGAGGFLPTPPILSGELHPLVSDIDGDGFPDLVAPAGASGLLVHRNTNCRARRLRFEQDISGCDVPGMSFSSQPRLRVTDDGGNVISCDTGLVAAGILPGTGAAGAALDGTKTAAAIGGVATFADLAVDLPGLGYRLEFSHAVAGKARSRTFSQGVTAGIAGPAGVCANGEAEYDAGVGYDRYEWKLDSAVVSRARRVRVGGLSLGGHTLSLKVEKDGCEAQSSVAVPVSEPPEVVITASVAVCPYASGMTASVGDAGVGASYTWTVVNGVITSGAGTRLVTFKAGPAGQAVLQVTVTNGQGCSASASKTIGVDATLSCPAPVGFFTVTPCRLLDTRVAGPALAAGSDRGFPIASKCGIPADATAVVVNVTVTGPTAAGDLRLRPGNTPVAPASVVNYRAGQTRAGNGIYALGAAGDLAVQCDQPTGSVHLILDIGGYFQ
ncbi:MAG: FG-GAP-like repeat-containing protein, partial [Thermoanaerobaculia bacterium]